jgi:hypothetical protein
VLLHASYVSNSSLQQLSTDLNKLQLLEHTNKVRADAKSTCNAVIMCQQTIYTRILPLQSDTVLNLSLHAIVLTMPNEMAVLPKRSATLLA